MKQKLHIKKVVKLFLIVIMFLIYYSLNRIEFKPFSIYLMLPIGFIFAYKIRDKEIDYIDKVVFMLILLIMIMIMVPPVDFLGIFKQYVLPTSNILGFIIFFFGYYLGYFITKDDITYRKKGTK